MSVEILNRRVICFVFLFVVVDVTVSTLLFSHVSQFNERLINEAKFYDFSASLLEFWVFGLIRTVVLFGFLIGVCWNRTCECIHRLEKAHIPVLVVVVSFGAYGVIKMLACTEDPDKLLRDSGAWFWAQFAWVEFGSLGFYISYYLLKTSGICELSEYEKTARNSINQVDGERQSLLNNRSADDEVKVEIKQRTTMQKASSVMRLMRYSKPDIPYMAVASIFMMLSSVAEIFTPWYTGQVIQGIAIDKSRANFTRAIILMGTFSAGSAICAGIRGGLFKIAMARLNIRIRNHLFASIVKQEVGFFDTTKTGDITSRLTTDTTTMSDALSLNFNIFIRSLIKAVGVCAFMFKLSWRLSMVTVVGLPVVMGISKLYGDYYEALSKKVQDSFARANEVAEEVCSSMRTVHSFANEDEEAKRYAERLNVTYRLKIKESFAFAGYMWSTQLFSLSLIVSTLFYGGHLVVSEMISGGDLVSFILYQMELGYALESISNVYSGLMQAVGASEKVFEYIDRKPEIPNSGRLAPDNLKGKLEFQNVTFSYPSRPSCKVLENVSFEVNPGEVVALVGPSGGGKSSCVNLLQHFYETQQGQVFLDGIPINEYDHKYLHKKISLVGQEPVLYGRSIKDNIAYGLETWDLDLVKRAAIQANAHNFIIEMKDQYDTEAGEKGTNLSGGQKQRIAIARAIIRDPTVLLLDEATSALDSESEHIVQEAIYSNLKGRTVVVIAHRLSTVERADRIIVINKGKIIEQGTHSELLKKSSGMYLRLVQRQMHGLESSGAYPSAALENYHSPVRSRDVPSRTSSIAIKSSLPSSGSDDDISITFGSPKYGSIA